MEEALQSMDWEYLFKLLELVLTVAAFTTMLGLFRICHWLVDSRIKKEEPREDERDLLRGPDGI